MFRYDLLCIPHFCPVYKVKAHHYDSSQTYAHRTHLSGSVGYGAWVSSSKTHFFVMNQERYTDIFMKQLNLFLLQIILQTVWQKANPINVMT